MTKGTKLKRCAFCFKAIHSIPVRISYNYIGKYQFAHRLCRDQQERMVAKLLNSGKI